MIESFKDKIFIELARAPVGDTENHYLYVLLDKFPEISISDAFKVLREWSKNTETILYFGFTKSELEQSFIAGWQSHDEGTDFDDYYEIAYSS